MALSAHFTLEELVRSDTAVVHGIDNTPSPAQLANLQRLVGSLLEPARALLGVPLYVNSGFRCQALNVLVHGKPNSAHLDGRAVDFVPKGGDDDATAMAWAAIRASELPYDQLILERSSRSTWIHMAIARIDETPRRQAFNLKA